MLNLIVIIVTAASCASRYTYLKFVFNHYVLCDVIKCEIYNKLLQ